jgi:hypothetical protein
MEQAIMGGPGCSVEEATVLVKLLHAADLPASTKSSLAKCLNARVCGSGGPVKKPKQEPQSCMFIHRFLPVWLWSLLAQPSATYHQVMLGVRSFARMLGLTSANEPTWLALASVVYIARLQALKGVQTLVAVSMQDVKKLTEDIKGWVKPSRRECKLPHWGRLLLYPNTPDELKAQDPDLWETAYADSLVQPENLPGDCPLDMGVLTELQGGAPQRKTHSSLVLSKPRRAPSFGCFGKAVDGSSLSLEDDAESILSRREQLRARREEVGLGVELSGREGFAAGLYRDGLPPIQIC